MALHAAIFYAHYFSIITHAHISILILFSYNSPGIRNGLFLSGFLTNIYYVFLISPVHVSRAATFANRVRVPVRNSSL